MPRNSLDELLELQVENLRGLFEFEHDAPILNFLRSHRDVFKLLREGVHALHAAFDDSAPEGEYSLHVLLIHRDDLLVATILEYSWWPSHTVEEKSPEDCFLSFEQDWWLKNCQRPGGSSIAFEWGIWKDGVSTYNQLD